MIKEQTYDLKNESNGAIENDKGKNAWLGQWGQWNDAEKRWVGERQDKNEIQKKRERELSSLSNKGPCMIPSGYTHTHTLLLSDSVTTATEQRVNRRSNCPSTCRAWECWVPAATTAWHTCIHACVSSHEQVSKSKRYNPVTSLTVVMLAMTVSNLTHNWLNIMSSNEQSDILLFGGCGGVNNKIPYLLTH